MGLIRNHLRSAAISEPLEFDLALMRRLVLMPKAEIHVHLEGTMAPETVWQLAQQNQILLPAPSLEKWRESYAFTNFSHFIDTYTSACHAIAREEDFIYILDRFATQQAAQNICYTEVFVSASLHLSRFRMDALLDALATGVSDATRTHKVGIRIIPDLAREQPDSQNDVFRFALKGRDLGIFVGLGLGGRETEYPSELFRETFSEARRQGLHVVAHAGEVMGPESVRKVLDVLHVERIGHGIRCLEDASLVTRLRHDQIPLEVCPTSNYRTGAVPSGRPHPLRAMTARGLSCTINSDDPAMFETSLTNEYGRLAAQGFNWNELWRLNRATLNAAFLEESERKTQTTRPNLGHVSRPTRRRDCLNAATSRRWTTSLCRKGPEITRAQDLEYITRTERYA